VQPHSHAPLPKYLWDARGAFFGNAPPRPDKPLSRLQLRVEFLFRWLPFFFRSLRLPPPPLLDVAYRSRQLAFRRTQISQWLAHEHSELRLETDSLKREGKQYEEYFSSRVSGHQEKDALALAIYGMLEGTDPRVAPLRRALAVWGLTADDIGVLSIHGTSTGANVGFLPLLTRLILTSAYAVPIMAQKCLLRHSKGGSAAWQMMGLLQTVISGIIPGNRNGEYV